MRESISANSVANAVRMKRQVYATHMFLIVEGGTDSRLFSKFFSADACRIEIANGKPNALAALKTLTDDQFEQVFAIVDADFDRIQSVDHPERVFLSDHHDVECMMFKSEAFGSFVAEHVVAERRSKFGSDSEAILNRLVREACKIGKLRLLCLRKELEMSFKTIKHLRFVDRETLSVDQVALVNHVCDINNRYDVDRTELAKELDRFTFDERETWDMVCGHDLSAILGIALRHALAASNKAWATIEFVESGLRVAYSNAEFRKTILWTNLRDFEVTQKRSLLV